MTTMIYVHDAASHLPGLGYDLLLGADVDRLNADLHAMSANLLDWSYDFGSGDLSLRFFTPIPEEQLSAFGTLEVGASAR